MNDDYQAGVAEGLLRFFAACKDFPYVDRVRMAAIFERLRKELRRKRKKR